jgi:hypothetical protein
LTAKLEIGKFVIVASISNFGGRVGVGGGTLQGGPSDNCTRRGRWEKVGKFPNDGKAINFW